MKYKPDAFTIRGKTFKPYLAEEKIRSKVDELAERINKDYEGEKVFFLIVLKGSIFFAADLLRRINVDLEIETIRARSYGLKMNSESVDLQYEKLDIEGKRVLIIEDIVDTGKTLDKTFKSLSALEPASLEAASFLTKPDNLVLDVKVKYVGFEMPPQFVIGYGLDYAERGRNLPDIYILDE